MDVICPYAAENALAQPKAVGHQLSHVAQHVILLDLLRQCTPDAGPEGESIQNRTWQYWLLWHTRTAKDFLPGTCHLKAS